MNDVGSWLWVRYGVDFIKEAGEWKIWHLQVFPFFKTPFDKRWTVNAREQAVGTRAEVVVGAGINSVLIGQALTETGIRPLILDRRRHCHPDARLFGFR